MIASSKSCYGKISNFDSITSVIQEIAYGVLYNHFRDLGELLIIKIGTKLGNIESRLKNIYYARFIMVIANHVAPNLVVDQPENKLVCWVQNKRLFKDLVRINLHEGYSAEDAPGNTVYFSPPPPSPLYLKLPCIHLLPWRV